MARTSDGLLGATEAIQVSLFLFCPCAVDWHETNAHNSSNVTGNNDKLNTSGKHCSCKSKSFLTHSISIKREGELRKMQRNHQMVKHRTCGHVVSSNQKEHMGQILHKTVRELAERSVAWFTSFAADSVMTCKRSQCGLQHWNGKFGPVLATFRPCNV